LVCRWYNLKITKYYKENQKSLSCEWVAVFSLRLRASRGQFFKGADMAEGYLTTHVLDTARGVPAEGVAITLYRITGEGRSRIAGAVTNADGRTDTPILPKDAFRAGVYELVFTAGAYLDACGVPPESPRFLDEIPLRFGISDETAHYHVPLLLSPFGYSTYRGS
jgi:5-hydroxyisourate hydrolase